MQVGKYKLVRKLATGGMAEVFLAKLAGPMGFEKEVVVKRILPEMVEEDGFVEMLFTEARLAARLNHPNIVQIFDFGQDDGTYYLAMEYIDGLDLRSLMKRVNAHTLALSPVFCAWLIARACEGLAFAHEARDPATGMALGLIHRDVSPDNILLSRQGALKIVDFGIAKAADQAHSTRAGIVKGKLSYMSPEQLQCKTLDRRVDVYALGVVFYELLTGRKPFNATTQSTMMKAILHEAPVPAVQRRPDLPEAVARILERALAKDRDQRYRDCLEFQSDLEDFILASGQKLGGHRIAQCVANVLELPPAPAAAAAPPSRAPRATPPPQSFLPTASPRHHTPPQPPRIAPLVPQKAHVPSPSRPESQAKPLPAPAAFKPHPRTGLWWALACAGLLLAGGGFLAWRLGGEQPRPASTSQQHAQPQPN
jgi:serine/threonine protein kinase